MLKMKVPAILLSIGVLCLGNATSMCCADDNSKITFRQQPGKIVICVDDKTIATYVYEDPQILRPYFTGLKAPSGVQVTRRHPPRKDVDADDHATMHPGLWLAFGDISGSDFWRNKARVKHAGFIKEPYVGGKQAGFTVRNQYMANGKIV